nr:T9SS type A sorting domain-containing protein [Bacteroidota bacterium]
MNKKSINIQKVVALIFLAIFLSAAYSTLFAQEKSEETSKERTKIVKIKVVEDENGDVKSIDTISVWHDENGMFYDGLDNFKFHMDCDEVPDNMAIWIDDEHNIHHLDSLINAVHLDEFKLDSLGEGAFFYSFNSDDVLINLDKEMGKVMKYVKRIDDSSCHNKHMKLLWVNEDEDCMDSINNKIIKKISVLTGEESYFISGDEDGMEVTEDGDIIMIKIGDKGTTLLEYISDTVITDGENRIMVKSKILKDGNMEKRIEVFTISESEELEGTTTRTVKVTVDGDNYHVWTATDEEGKDTESTIIVKSIDEDDKQELKDAGIKSRKKDLEFEDLKFAPNPSTGKFNLSFTLKEKNNVTINIFDLKGNLVYTETLRDFQGTYSKEINISDYGQGTFFLQIVQGLYDIIKKIIIQ